MKKSILFLALGAFILTSCNNSAQAPAAQAPVDKSGIVIENIKNRRSIRAYKPEQVSKDTVDLILQTAINAPSANNKQPWEIRVIQNPDVLNKIKAINEKALYGAPTVIVIANDTNNPYGAFDSGLLTQNILLTAESLGLGTVSSGTIAGILNSKEGAELTASLGLPEGYQPILGIVLGHKDQSPEAKPRDASKIKYVD